MLNSHKLIIAIAILHDTGLGCGGAWLSFLFSVFCFLFSVFCFLLSVFCFLFSVSCFLFPVSCFLFSVFCFLFSVFFVSFFVLSFFPFRCCLSVVFPSVLCLLFVFFRRVRVSLPACQAVRLLRIDWMVGRREILLRRIDGSQCFGERALDSPAPVAVMAAAAARTERTSERANEQTNPPSSVLIESYSSRSIQLFPAGHGGSIACRKNATTGSPPPPGKKP